MMTTRSTNENHEPTRIGRSVRYAQLCYAICVWLFVAGIAAQVFFAGSAVLVNPAYWNLHRALPQIIRVLPLLMLITAVMGKFPNRVLALTTLAGVLFVMQYVFIWIFGTIGLASLRGLHAVNALALFWITVHLGRRTWPFRSPALQVGHEKQGRVTSQSPTRSA